MRVELEMELRQLGTVRAPRTLYPRVMAGVGLVDSFAPLDTALGPAFVAWNLHGVSAVRRVLNKAHPSVLMLVLDSCRTVPDIILGLLNER